MRKKWLGSGWKMNKLLGEAEEYAAKLMAYSEQGGSNVEIFIVPPFTLLYGLGELLAGSPIILAAQNMHWESSGAFTGEISPRMLRDCGVQIVEIGHFERRKYWAETDYTVNKKVLAALQHGLRPLVCVGETAEDQQYDLSAAMLERQLKIGLYTVDPDQVERVMIAYEPAWAIGENGTPAEPSYSNQIHQVIRRILAGLFGEEPASRVPVLYGGSVNLENARTYLEQPDIDGLFVGRAALEANRFIELIQIAENVAKSTGTPP